jgi:two-component system, OmpR family, response regulator RpaA
LDDLIMSAALDDARYNNPEAYKSDLTPAEVQKLRSQSIFTTGQIARICNVAPRTVSKWFDSGKLQGYRIPGSQDRRVLKENLFKFMREYGLPIDERLLQEVPGLVLIDCQKALISEATRNADAFKFDLKVVEDTFTAGAVLSNATNTKVIIINASGLGLASTKDIVGCVRASKDLKNCIILGMLSEDCSEDLYNEFKKIDLTAVARETGSSSYAAFFQKNLLKYLRSDVSK